MTDLVERIRSAELQPCPFCGSDDIGHVIGKHTLRIACTACDVSGPPIEADAETPEAWTQAYAAWNRRPSSGEVREGWKLVPVEPTEDMLQAGIDNCALSISQDRAGSRQMTTPFEDECGGIYQAMLAVAPPPPVEPQGAQGVEEPGYGPLTDVDRLRLYAYDETDTFEFDRDQAIGVAEHIEAIEAESDGLASRLADYQDTHTDEQGNVWHRPTAWAYFAACRTIDAHKARIATLQQALERLIEAADNMGWSTNSSAADDAIGEARTALNSMKGRQP